MEVTIDKFGRILIPKKVRQRLGLQAGQALELTSDTDSRTIALQAPTGAKSLEIVITDFGFPVIQNGESIEEDFNNIEFLKETQRDYLDRKMGLE